MKKLPATVVVAVLGIVALARIALAEGPGTRSPTYKTMKAIIERQNLPAADKARAMEAVRALVAGTRARQRVLRDGFGGPVTDRTGVFLLEVRDNARPKGSVPLGIVTGLDSVS